MPFNNPITGGQGALVRERIKSPDYIAGVQGWSINKDGSAEFNNVTVRGELFVTDPDGSYVHIFNENPGDGSVIELRLPDSAGAVIVPARIRSGVTPHFTDPALEVLGPNVDGNGTAAIYFASGPTGGGVVELHAEDYAWFDTNGCSWVVAGDWELAHEIAPNTYAIHFQVWVDGTVIAGAIESDTLTVRAGGSVIIQAGDLDVTGDAAVSGDVFVDGDVSVAATGGVVGNGIGVVRGAARSTDLNRTNTVAVTADPVLQLSVVANAVYIYEASLAIDADAAADMNIGHGAPAGATLANWRAVTQGTGGAWTETRANLAATLFLSTNGAVQTCLISGTLRTGANAGTFSLNWGPNANTALNSTMLTDSWIKLTRIA